jgi:hypothetical protein
MAIQRSGPTPSFYEYICGFVLVPHTTTPSPQLMSLVGPGQQLHWVDIPSFQRGISWDLENVKDLLHSDSILLGNAILSQFNVNAGQFPKLPPSQSLYLVLVDGLQRLAVGTAILSVLHDPVLCNSPGRPGDAVHFTALSARVAPLSAFYLHNNAELLGHPRQAVRDQYLGLRQAISRFCVEELDKGRAAQLAASVVKLFLSRQVALDIYFNFNRNELLSTFIGINTVRVDLGPVDLLRASILEQATLAGWPQAQLEATENDFTDTLTEDQKPKQDLLPFVNAALKALASGKGARLFPSWGTQLNKHDVDEFLDFIDLFESAISTNAYLAEIRECGKLPVSTVLAFYYLDYLHGSKTKPPFFVGGTSVDSDLHAYLLACYRLLLDGTIGRTSENLQHLVNGTSSLTLPQLADAISLAFLGRPISTNVDTQWLETQLNQVDQKRAPRIFNAMLLPPRATLGYAFTRIQFGRAAKMFHVDHLIPESLLNQSAPGGLEGQTLRNFAPLPTNQNRVAKATSCSSKLAVGGIYQTYVGGSTHFVHPYCQWLLTSNAPPYTAVLDTQANLERNISPDVGTLRVKKIAGDLLARI